MRAIIIFLTVLMYAITAQSPAASAKNKEGDGSSYLIDGIKYRGEGNCEEAIKSYQTARRLKQFKEDWVYHLAVADCYVALRKYDDAIDAYTKVIDSTKNKALQGEMYRGRGKAYYLKSIRTKDIDKKYLDLARKDLYDAKILGVDVSDIEKSMSADMALKPVAAKSGDESNTVISRQVAVLEGPHKIIAGDGEYVVYISGDTLIKDKSGLIIAASEIKPGDNIDFSYITAYRNRADGMLHASAKTVTLNRDASKIGLAEVISKPHDAVDTGVLYARILQKLDRIDADLKDMKEKQQPIKKEPPKKSKIKKKPSKKSPETDKKNPLLKTP
ncbi:MAG: hypothetical protein HY099_02300 [Nitrospirae bacterium]|nr:hypothetical protein [Nitrospirota bacterium]